MLRNNFCVVRRSYRSVEFQTRLSVLLVLNYNVSPVLFTRPIALFYFVIEKAIWVASSRKAASKLKTGIIRNFELWRNEALIYMDILAAFEQFELQFQRRQRCVGGNFYSYLFRFSIP